MHDDLEWDAKVKKLDERGSFAAFEPLNGRDITKAAVNTRWALTWKMMRSKKRVQARLVAKGPRPRI